MNEERRAVLRTKVLRRMTLVLLAVGLVAIVLAFVPSVEVYKDANDCLGDALGRVFSHHSGERTRCENRWVLVETRGPGGASLGTALYFAILMLPGLLVWLRPRLLFALLWPVWTIGATVVMLVATFDLFGELGTRTVRVFPAQIFTAAATTLVGATILIVPLVCLVFAIVTRSRPPPPPVFPTARVVER